MKNSNTFSTKDIRVSRVSTWDSRKVLTKFMVIVPEPFVGIFNGLSGVGPQSEPFVSSTFFQPQIVDVGLQTFELLFGIDHDKRRLPK